MFESTTITGMSLTKYRDLIPEGYYSKLERNEFDLTVIREIQSGGSIYAGLCVSNHHSEWFEIIWIHLSESVSRDSEIADFLRYITMSARRLVTCEGVFLQIHKSEILPRTAAVLKMAGFETSVHRNNIYSFRICDINSTELKPGNHVFLKDAPPEIIARTQNAISKSERPVPVPALVPWEEYNSELSVLYNGEGSDVGSLLFSDDDGRIVFSLAFATSPVILGQLLYAACDKARKTLSPDTEVLAPVVFEGSRKLIEHFVPNAQSGQVLEATMRFARNKNATDERPVSLIN